jgi:hypothetical protein
MKPGTPSLKHRTSSSSGSSTSQSSRPASAPSVGRGAVSSKKNAKLAAPMQSETVMPVPNKPLILEQKYVSDSGKARLSW